MRCEEAKECIRKGWLERATGHLSSCSDCRTFADDFGEVVGVLAKFPVISDTPEKLFRETLSLAKAELKSCNATDASSRVFRTVAAGVFATVLAPILIVLNYIIAAGGQILLTKWLPPIFGAVFFVGQTLVAIISLSIAYGSLPLLIAAARNILHERTNGGGLTA